MKRNLEDLFTQEFDVLVVGGGIHGAMAAWDAALRGLSVALIERGDFGGATSQNSLRIIHGGLRYLQDGNPGRIRTMARERTTWMKIAPHLVHPLKCLTPSYTTKLSRNRIALGIALTLNDLISFDRNRLADPEKFLHAGRTISTQECGRLLPGYEDGGLTGAAVWNDAQIYNSERLVLAFVLSAAQAGAKIANYVEAARFLQNGDRVSGVRARDVLSGQEFDIQAKVVINAAGAWIDQLLESIQQEPAVRSGYVTSIAIDLIVKQVWPGCAVGLPSHPGGNKRSQMLFIVPWRDKSMIGTWHIPWHQSPDTFQMKDAIIQEFLDEINSAHPRLNLSLQDVENVHWGFLPVNTENSQRAQVKLTRDSMVIDHQKENGLPGLMSIIGVKYTTARVTAQKAVDLVVNKLGLPEMPSRTENTPVQGGQIERFQDFLRAAQTESGECLAPEIIAHLVYTYGSEYKTLLHSILEQPELGERIDPHLPITRAEILHAVRHEMAQKLIDVIQRRTEAGTIGLPAVSVLQKCAAIMGEELGWDAARQAEEIDAVINAYPIKKGERVAA